MDAQDVLALGLGVTPPRRLVEQRLETNKQPHVLDILLEAERGGGVSPIQSATSFAGRMISRNSLGDI